MGLLSGVLLLPLAPVRGVEWVAGRLLDAADRELCDPTTLRARLAALNSAFEAGEIDEEEFEREEERLLDLLEHRTPTVARTPSPTDGTTPPQTTTHPHPHPRPQARTGTDRGNDHG